MFTQLFCTEVVHIYPLLTFLNISIGTNMEETQKSSGGKSEKNTWKTSTRKGIKAMLVVLIKGETKEKKVQVVIERMILQCPWLVLMGWLTATTSLANVGNEIKALLQSTSSMTFQPMDFCQSGVKPSRQLWGPGNPKSNTDLIDNQKVEDWISFTKENRVMNVIVWFDEN